MNRPTIFLLPFLFAFILFSCKADDDTIPSDCTGIHWDHFGQHEWSHLCTGFSACGGQSQSPVNIDNPVEDATIPLLQFEYGFTSVEIENNGNTIEFACDSGSYLIAGATTYRLLQFHYHALSEHQVDGNHAPLEIHFVHQAAENQLAVVGIFIEEGAPNELFTNFLADFPISKGVFKSEAELDLAGLLPEDKSFYHYSGSLTTPPCSEIVLWYVLKALLTASADQIGTLQAMLHNNYREVQDLNNRLIYSRNE